MVDPLTDASPGQLVAFDGQPYLSVYDYDTQLNYLKTWDGVTLRTAYESENFPLQMVAGDNALYFTELSADESANSLYRLDESGVALLLETPHWINQLTPVGDEVFFVQRIEGTPVLTTIDGRDEVRLTDDVPDVAMIDGLQAFAGLLYFALTNQTNNSTEWWTSDGTKDGTQPIGTTGPFQMNLQLEVLEPEGDGAPKRAGHGRRRCHDLGHPAGAGQCDRH